MLEGGADRLVMSVGALADPALMARITTAAERHGRRLHVPAGAIGGLDVLRAASLDRLDEGTLITSKPPRALPRAAFFVTHPVDPDAVGGGPVIFDRPPAEAVR